MKNLFFLSVAAFVVSCSSLPSDILNDMSYDSHTFKQQYELNKSDWDAAFAFLADPAIDTMEAGPWHQITPTMKGRIQLMDTKAIEEGKWEIHRQVTDIFYILDGVDVVGYSDKDSVSDCISPYSEEKDYEMYAECTSPQYMTLSRGKGCILFPGQAHSNGLCQSETAPLRLVVIKVPWVEK